MGFPRVGPNMDAGNWAWVKARILKSKPNCRYILAADRNSIREIRSFELNPLLDKYEYVYLLELELTIDITGVYRPALKKLVRLLYIFYDEELQYNYFTRESAERSSRNANLWTSV